MKHLWILLPLLVFASCKKGGGPPKDAPVPVELVAVETGPLLETLRATGTLDAEESVDLKPEVDGEITSIQMTEGANVKKGERLLQIDESKQQATVAEAEADFRLSEENRRRADLLLTDGTISQQEHDQVQSAFRRAQASLNLARKRLTEFTLNAPFDGTLGRRNVSVGQYVSPQTILVSIYALDRMKLDFNIAERYLARVKPGQTLSLTVAAHGDEKFSGEIYLVEPKVDVETRTVRVRAYLPNADHRLKPGMFANVTLSVGTRDSALTLPEDCVFPHTGGFAVYRDAGGVAELVPVEIGLRVPGRVEILSGLQAGNLVARSGNLRLSPGRKLLPQPASP
ncbi:MAG: efflux RND transporter periplasmic adaptor subunit [Verrucomicrobia bacterium]|nr:efflux RND transporter periplasmic adaptor subunit [Verrucomicrobiota bacterium]